MATKKKTLPRATSTQARAKSATKPARKLKAGANPLVDKALSAHWKDAFQRFEDAKQGEAERWDEQYEALGEILDAEPPLYLAGGYASDKAFLAAVLPGVDVRSARRSCRVARYFDAEDEATHGVMRLEALLDYLEATHDAPLVPAKINTKKQRVRVSSGKSTRSVLFADATLAVLRASIRRATKAPATRSSPAVMAVKAALAKHGFSEVAVSIRDNRLTLSGIPVGRLSPCARALTAAKV
jgi:hypothetical protein